jgi:hypothetical protein
MMHLGMGYDLWARIVDKTLMADKLDNLLMVAYEAKKDPSLIQRYFLSSWDPGTLTQLALNNGPCKTITNVQSDNYPQAAHMIKKFFLPNLPAPGFPQAMAAPSTFTFKLPGELEKESKAKKGITKLMLLHICTDINYKRSPISNISFETTSIGMEVVLSHPHATRSTFLADLICQILLMTKEQDYISI